MNIKPFTDRVPDTQYRDLLRDILEHGVRTPSQQGVDALTLMAPKPLHFKLENGFPLITERNMSPKTTETLPVTVWQQAIGEILAFINGARTQKELEKFGCYWWRWWVTKEKCEKRGLEEGDLGPGSYGAAFHDFPTAEGENFNQFKTIIEQIKERPHLRTHFISPWIPQYTSRVKDRQQKVVVCPCHGWVHIRVIENKLTLHMIQRSCDVPVGMPQNLIQYAALALAIAHVTGTEAHEYIHSISDAHIYVDQVDSVKTMLEREPRKLPTLSLTPEALKKTDLFDFRREDFALSDYDPHPGIKKIPVAI
ncbi:MAG: thymidylate synthase [Patescibacteria group bacterium]|nr:thymidylate synthase [Patescibacteria group bacterium]MDE1940823.1 thymidylate synthase [Patescibacteria group bacterium]MDE1966733.1 thymidylate synthase [Patescibacteria group bacterium]